MVGAGHRGHVLFYRGNLDADARRVSCQEWLCSALLISFHYCPASILRLFSFARRFVVIRGGLGDWRQRRVVFFDKWLGRTTAKNVLQLCNR
jgi:hypothetical protein